MEDPVSLFGIDDNIHLIRATVKIIYWKFEEMGTNITKDGEKPASYISPEFTWYPYRLKSQLRHHLRLFLAFIVEILMLDVPLSLDASLIDLSCVYPSKCAAWVCLVTDDEGIAAGLETPEGNERPLIKASIKTSLHSTRIYLSWQ